MKMQSKSQSKFFAILVASTSMLFPLACRSKMDVTTKEKAKSPGPDTNAANTNNSPQVEIPGGVRVEGQKVRFQSRGIVSILIDKQVVDGASTFSVLNTTNSNGDDNNAVQVVSEGVPQMGLADNGTFSMTEVAGEKVKITFFPSSFEWKSKFVYGLNTLKVLATHPNEVRYGTTEVEIKDFTVFSFAATAFSGNTQIIKKDGADGYQFQGWVNHVATPMVTAGDKSLIAEMFDMINR